MKLVFRCHSTIVETVISSKIPAIISSVTVSWINIVCDITSISANPLWFSPATITPLDRFPHVTCSDSFLRSGVFDVPLRRMVRATGCAFQSGPRRRRNLSSSPVACSRPRRPSGLSLGLGLGTGRLFRQLGARNRRLEGRRSLANRVRPIDPVVCVPNHHILRPANGRIHRRGEWSISISGGCRSGDGETVKTVLAEGSGSVGGSSVV